MSSPPFPRRRQFQLEKYEDPHLSQVSNWEAFWAAQDSQMSDRQDQSWYLDRDFDYRNIDHFSVTEEMLNLADDPKKMKDWLASNYSKVEAYDVLKFDLTRLLKDYMPGFSLEDDYPLSHLIASLDYYLKELHQKIDKCNVELGELSGSELAAKISSHKERVLDLINDLEAKLTKANEEIAHHVVENAELHNQLTSVWFELDFLKRKHFDEETTLDEKKFMEDLKAKANAFENKQSSLLEELERRREENNELQRQVVQYAKQIVHSEENCMKEIASLSQSLDLNATIEERLMSMLERNTSLQSSTPNPAACENVVQDWIRMIREAVKENKSEFEEVNYQIQQTNDELVSLQEQLEEARKEVIEQKYKVQQANEHLEFLQEQLEDAKREAEEAKAELEDMTKVRNEFLELIARRDEELQGLALQLGPVEEARISSGQETALTNPLPSHEGSGLFFSSEGEMQSGASPIAVSSFGITPPLSPVLQDSPFVFETQQCPLIRVDPMSQSLTTTRVAPGTQNIDPGSRRVALANQTIPQASRRIALGTQTLPSRGGRIAPRTQTLAQETSRVVPGTQTVGRVHNRFDVGSSLGMRTTLLNKPQPYAQTTRLASTQPVAGPSRMIDSPLQIRHRAEFTPSSYRTPWISTTRFGYTDPTAKCLNLPPGDDLVFDDNQPANQGAVKKTVLLTSPQRQNPLLVNIDVLPRPLIHSSSGEHFVCDISLDVQDAKTQKTPITMVYRTPDVTPTTTRRHGLIGTPRGIYKRNQRAIRRLFPTSDASSSPKDLDKTLFVSSTSPDMGFQRTSPTMNQSFQVPTSPGLNQTIVRTSPGLNDTFVRTSPGLNDTFVRTSPGLNQTFVRTSPGLNETFVRTSPGLNQPFVKTSPGLNDTFVRTSPGLNDTFVRTSPRLKQPFVRTSPGLNETFVRTSPGLNATSQRTSPGLNVRQRLSPLLREAFNRTSPRLNETIERTSPGLGRRQRLSPLLNRALDRTSPIAFSSPKDVYRTLSSGYPDSTFGTTLPTVFDQTISSSASPESNLTGTYERTSSGQNCSLGLDSFQSEYSSPGVISSPKYFDRSFSSGYPGSTFGTTQPTVFDHTIASSASPEILDRSSLNSSSERSSPRLNRTSGRISPGLNVRQRLSPLLNEALGMSSPGLSSSSGMNGNSDQQGDVTFNSSGTTDSFPMS